MYHSDTFQRYHADRYVYVPWSEKTTIKTNGRLSSFLFYKHQEAQSRLKLNTYRAREVNVGEALFAAPPKVTPNIHMIVLESFIDPRRLNGTYTPDPLGPKLRPFLLPYNDGFSRVYSPVYGGGTAQAEFELLTGVKALSRVNSIEFNVMRGGQLTSLTSQLKRHRYHLMATIGAGKSFFNSVQAYRSLGFEAALFMEEASDFTQPEDDIYLFDGSVFNYNLKRVEAAMAERDDPLFNYVLGMYGHTPIHRNHDRRPDRVKVIHSDDQVRRVANQFYYRTNALADYLETLATIDPDAIVYITSDHLPSILSEEIEYDQERNVNISLLRVGDRALDVTGLFYYEIPWLIWDLMSGQEVDRGVDERSMERFYYKILAESVF